MTRLMYDAVDWQAIPDDSPLVAGYIDGRYAWPAEAWAKFAAQRRRAVGITVFASVLAGDLLDIELTDATPAQGPGWVLGRRAGGAWPSLYMNESTWPEVRFEWARQVPHLPEPPYVVAFYNGDPAIPDGAVAHQFIDPPGSGGDYDRSSVRDYWPGVDPVPPVRRKVFDPVFIYQLPNGSLYASNGVTFRWLNGQSQVDTLKYSIVATGATVFEGNVATWQQMGVPADQRSAQAAGASWPPLAG